MYPSHAKRHLTGLAHGSLTFNATSFNATSAACQRNDWEKVFRVKSNLTGDASEYAFTQIPQVVSMNYDGLVIALEARYKEH